MGCAVAALRRGEHDGRKNGPVAHEGTARLLIRG